MRVEQQPAYVLHTRPYSESSWLVDVFTRSHGRLMLLAKGARRPKSRTRGVLLPFRPLLIGWAGKGSLPVLSGAEQTAHGPALCGDALTAGFYLNELLLRLLHRHDAHESLYEYYHTALTDLTPAPQPALRIFEKRLLREIGFGLALEHDCDTGLAITDSTQYHYVPEKGPVAVAPHNMYALPVHGSTLQAMRDEVFPGAGELRQAASLTRTLIDRQLGGRALRSRRVMLEMRGYRHRASDESGASQVGPPAEPPQSIKPDDKTGETL